MASDYSVEIDRVTKRFGDFVALHEVSLDIRRGEFFSLLGPSGCGKTTLLRMIGGFELPTAGTIRINGTDVTNLPPNKRPVNMVFQHYALFPHLSVAENVAFGLRYKDVPKAQEAKRVFDALSMVRLGGFEKRLPNQLSGGQRQRVALARALAMEPEVLLLDEPLGALDQKLRKEVQVELKNLQRSLGITFVFVTHDQEEALTMSDRIAVMNQGHVEQMDASAEVFEHPQTEFVAHFMGAANFFTAHVRDFADGLLSLSLLPGDVFRLKPKRQKDWRQDDEVHFVVRPEKLDLRTRDLSDHGVPSVQVTIEDRVYQGVSTVWIVKSDDGRRYLVYDQNERPYDETTKFGVGSRVWLCWNARHTVLMDAPAGPAAAAPASEA
jgi:spermidine/putrescine transport system ATP-binding protein